jgi:xanthine dehydrogenase accessory factor
MDNDLATLTKAIEWLKDGEQVALATVIQTWGSSPRPLGSHMVIRSDGLFFGSVSAGCVENSVVAGALAALDCQSPQILDFGVSAWRNGLSCGGKIAVLVQPLADAAPLRRVLDALAAGKSCALGFDHTQNLMDFDPPLDTTSPEYFVRLYQPSPRLIISGAVHIAEPLTIMAGLAGFEVTIVDPRREFAVRGAYGKPPVIAWPEAYFRDHPATSASAIISLTHAPRIDHPTLCAALKSPAFYIGALGSAPTHAKRLHRLAKDGFAPAQLSRIHGPIGLPIKASSPAEIAVSILAEIIAVRRTL